MLNKEKNKKRQLKSNPEIKGTRKHMRWEIGWDGMGCHGMEWNGMGWDGMGWYQNEIDIGNWIVGSMRIFLS